ncbi:hypothetical protein LTR10_001340 [Elasticomyces elasticus]|nr:hypothetical protein LTR10_001340 [Elasticomyces elasticus]
MAESYTSSNTMTDPSHNLQQPDAAIILGICQYRRMRPTYPNDLELQPILSSNILMDLALSNSNTAHTRRTFMPSLDGPEDASLVSDDRLNLSPLSSPGPASRDGLFPRQNPSSIGQITRDGLEPGCTYCFGTAKTAVASVTPETAV